MMGPAEHALKWLKGRHLNRIGLNDQHLGANPVECISVRFPRWLQHGSTRPAILRTARHQPIERASKDDRHRWVLMRVQRQPEQRRKPHPCDMESRHIDMAGVTASHRHRNVGRCHADSPIHTGRRCVCATRVAHVQDADHPSPQCELSGHGPHRYEVKEMSGITRFATILTLSIVLTGGGPTAGKAIATPTGTADTIVARASGHTYVLLGPSVFGVTVQQDPLAYTATMKANGSVTGRWEYHYFEAGVETTFQGTVTCLTVRGNRAWIGGPITASSDSAQVGNGAWWQVADNGIGRHPVVPDRTTFVGIGTLGQTQAYCDNAPEPRFIFDVQRGFVRVAG